jgi:putative colanic acid biosynthesis acetyltransferase WcaB
MFNRIIKNNPNLKGAIIVVCYYFAHSFRVKCKNKFTLILCSPIIILYKFISDIVLGCEIPVSTKIGTGLIIHHGRCLVLNKNVVIGDNVTLKHNTTIGNKEGLNGEDLGSPIIGDNVIIGPNTVIIGAIKIGDNAVIGAGSVVVKDVEKNSVVAGNPAKLIRRLI